MDALARGVGEVGVRGGTGPPVVNFSLFQGCVSRTPVDDHVRVTAVEQCASMRRVRSGIGRNVAGRRRSRSRRPSPTVRRRPARPRALSVLFFNFPRSREFFRRSRLDGRFSAPTAAVRPETSTALHGSTKQ